MTTKLIYTSPKRKIFVQIRDILLAVVMSLFFISKREDIELFFERLFGQNNGEVILYFILITIFLVPIFYFLSRRKKIIGILNMSDELLSIKTKKGTSLFRIKQLTNFKVKTSYFIPNEENVGLHSSYNNWLLFEYMEKNYMYQFIIDSNYKGNQFDELINLWKKNEKFTLIEEK